MTYPSSRVRALLGAGRRWWRVALLLWPALALLGIGAAHRGERTALLPAFLTVVILWPATIATGRLAGVRAGALGGLLCVALFWLQAVLPAPAPELQRSLLLKRLDSPQQAVRHVMRLPLASREWRAVWSATPAPVAYLYVMVMTAPGSDDPRLQVQLGGQPLGELSTATWAGVGNPSPETGSAGWHRLRVERGVLEQDGLLEVSIAPTRREGFVPGGVGLFGGYSLRPTVPPAPSALFDGERWSTDASTLLPDWPAGLKGAVRYYVELRIVQPATRRVLGIYY